MKKIFSIWENTSKTGNTYYTGKLGEVDLIGFKNTNKTNPKAPDIEFYIREDKKEIKKEETKKDVFEEFSKVIQEDMELPFE